jgi:hypothetical protein
VTSKQVLLIGEVLLYTAELAILFETAQDASPCPLILPDFATV